MSPVLNERSAQNDAVEICDFKKYPAVLLERDVSAAAAHVLSCTINSSLL